MKVSLWIDQTKHGILLSAVYWEIVMETKKSKLFLEIRGYPLSISLNKHENWSLFTTKMKQKNYTHTPPPKKPK